MLRECSIFLKFVEFRNHQKRPFFFKIDYIINKKKIIKTSNMKKISLLQICRTICGERGIHTIFSLYTYYESFTTTCNMTTASITTVLNLIISVFVSIALSTLCSLSLFSLQSSDIYLFHFKRRKRKKVQIKRFRIYFESC